MDTKQSLIHGLMSDPKHIPVWYRYDKQGSEYNDVFLSDNKLYYFFNSEMDILKNNIQDIVNEIPDECVLVEMGSGNSLKSRMFIDALLKKQTTLKYYPVDISEVFLAETCKALADDYGDVLSVCPVPGDYSVGIEKIRDIPGKKLIIWLGGGFQNQPYNVQVDRIACLARTMTEDDRLCIALDITQTVDEVEKAYLDNTATTANLYLNAIWRLNKEYGSNIDTDKFELEAKFEKTDDKDSLSLLKLRAKSKLSQTFEIPGLGITISFSPGEYLNMYEGEAVSCKYTEEQIRTLVQKGHQRLIRTWVDAGNHVALCCIGTIPS